jgi:hypothetical protein
MPCILLWCLLRVFQVEGEGYDNKLSLTREQFCEALSLLLKKGGREEVSNSDFFVVVNTIRHFKNCKNQTCKVELFTE